MPHPLRSVLGDDYRLGLANSRFIKVNLRKIAYKHMNERPVQLP